MQVPREAPGDSWSCSCNSCTLKSPLRSPPFDEILFLQPKLHRRYYKRYKPLREKLLNEFIKTRSGYNELRTIFLLNTLADLKTRIHSNHDSQTKCFPEITITILDLNKLTNKNQRQYTKLSKSSNNVEELHACNILQRYSRGLTQTSGRDARRARARSTGSSLSESTTVLQTNWLHGTQVNTVKLRDMSDRRLESRQYKMGKDTTNMTKKVPNVYLQIEESATSNSTYKTTVGRKSRYSLALGSGSGITTLIFPSDEYLRAKNLNSNVNKTSKMLLLPKDNYPENSSKSWTSFSSIKYKIENQDFYSLINSNSCLTSNLKKCFKIVHLKYSEISKITKENPCSSCYSQEKATNSHKNKLSGISNKSNSYAGLFHFSSAGQSDDQGMRFQIQHCNKLKQSLKVVLGPYAQTQAVYNVMEQTLNNKKEKGTSQQFKRKSQGIGTASSSQRASNATNDSSTTTPRRRAIKVESSVSFSVEFFNRQKSTASDVPGHEDTGAQKGKKGIKRGKKKSKSLHRCFCTLSFPTEDKKIKPRSCEPGVCVSGECNPSECFQRIQKKFSGGSKKSKKKSASEISSSLASQTKKTKGKKDGTLVKEKGSSSISKYKESIKEVERPSKEKEKLNFASYLTNCCNKLRCWRKGKDTLIALKHAVTNTNIAGTTKKASPDGSNASSQMGKKQDKKKKKLETKETVNKTTTKAVKKGKEAAEKEAKETIKEGEIKKEAGKKGKKNKKSTIQEVEKDTPAMEQNVKKGKRKRRRPLKPFECEPGVCSRKVCTPLECYERKFPPPPMPVPATTSVIKIKKILRKCCCRRTIPEGEVSLNAATQSRKLVPGVTVYKEKGSSGRNGGLKKLKAETAVHDQPLAPLYTPEVKGRKSRRDQRSTRVDAGVPPSSPMESRNVRGQIIDTSVPLYTDGDHGLPADSRKSRKQKAFTGIQYYQNVDNELKTNRQGVNIGSECSCSVEFYKMVF